MKRYIFGVIIGLWFCSQDSLAQIKGENGLRLVTTGNVQLVTNTDFTLDATSNLLSSATSTLLLNGAAQNLNLGSTATPLGNLVVAGTANKTLQSNASVATNLNFAGTNANLNLGNFNIAIADVATVTGAASATGFVNTNGTGQYLQGYTAVSNKIMHVGTGTNYTPLTLNMAGATISPNAAIGVRATAGKDANTDAANYLNRYWNITTNNITNVNATLSGVYVSGELVGTNVKPVYYGASACGDFGATNITASPTTTVTINPLATSGVFTGSSQACTIYVRTDGNDTNCGLANTAAGAKLTLQAAFNVVTDGCVVVLNAGTYNETATLTNKSITLQSVGNPTVQTIVLNGAGKTVTLTGGLNISEMLNLQAGDLASAGNLTLLATATKQAMLIQGTGTNVTGNVNVQRYLRANTGIGGTTSLGYRFVSSPTSNATLTQLSELSPVVNAAFNGAAFPGRITPFPTLYSYNPTLAGDPAKTFITSPFPEFDKGWVSPATLGENMNVGQGFTVNTSANQVLEITGLLNNGNVNIPVVVGNAASLGYNLVGNPYPSPIKWSDVLAASSNVNNAIYQNMATGQYTGAWASYVGGVSVNGATDDIAVMQGFFVIANAAGNVNFTNATRATTYTNPNSFRTEDDTNNNKNASKNNGLLRLAMTNAANKTDETVVYFADKATANFDKELDAVKFQLNGGNFPNIYTTDNKTEKNTLFSINALPTLNDDLLVPVTLQSWNGGVQKIAMTEKLNFTREVQVFLKDKSTNTLHDFSKGAFEFTATSGVLANRFELVFKPQFTAAELQGDNLNVYPNPSSEVLNISIGDDYKGELTLRLIDVTGREVWATKAEKTSKIYENSVNLSNFASGTYILEVSGAKKMVKKVVKN
jgi:hypothetical protein